MLRRRRGSIVGRRHHAFSRVLKVSGRRHSAGGWHGAVGWAVVGLGRKKCAFGPEIRRKFAHVEITRTHLRFYLRAHLLFHFPALRVKFFSVPRAHLRLNIVATLAIARAKRHALGRAAPLTFTRHFSPLRPLPLPCIVEKAFAHLLNHAFADFIVARSRVQLALSHLVFKILAKHFSHALRRRRAGAEWPAPRPVAHRFSEARGQYLAELLVDESAAVPNRFEPLAPDTGFDALESFRRRLFERLLRLLSALLHPLLIFFRHQIVLHCKGDASLAV